MIHYLQCPACNSTAVQLSLSAKDHTVSQKIFEIWKCEDCTLLFTQDVPSEQGIGPYYASQDYVSHSDTQEGFINGLYHKVRDITLRGKKKLVEQESRLSKGRILDIGCGTGAFLNKMKLSGWTVKGIEPDAGARAKAFSLYDIQPEGPESLFGLQHRQFNAITMWHVLEHVHRLHEYVEQIKGLLADAGRLFIAVPNYTSADAQRYKEYWAAYDVPRHLYHFSPESMKMLMDMHGLEVKKIKPMWFDSFYVSMLSEKYKNGGNIASAFMTGLVSNIKAMFNKQRCSSLIYIIGIK